MIKQFLYYLLLLLIIILLIALSTKITAAEYSNVTNESVTGVFELSHSVSRSSFFKTMIETSDIKEAGTTKLGRFFVRNNTRDGFSISIVSSEEGLMVPSGPSSQGNDGEVAIPYNIKIVKEGDVGTGIDSDFEHASNDLTNEVFILSTAGDSVSSGTDAEFSLFIEVVDDEKVMEMSGTYSDTLTITYTDQ